MSQLSQLSRRVAAVAAAVAAVVSVPVASASALAPPPSSPAPTGPDLSLSVRADSVVATATLHYSGALPAVTLAWGDGTSSRPSPPNTSLPGQPVPSAGSVVFQHAYEANGGALTKRVSVLSALTGRELLSARRRDPPAVPRHPAGHRVLTAQPLRQRPRGDHGMGGVHRRRAPAVQGLALRSAHR